ncbi:beta-lactamase [Trichoderma evansii]
MDHLVQGTHRPCFSSLRDLLVEDVFTEDEDNSSTVVNIDDKNAIDMWGDFFNESGPQNWAKDALANVFTITKTITSLAVLILIDRGIISPYEKVATYWPELSLNGEQDVKIKDIISHTPGVPGWKKPATLADICDFDQMVTLLAGQVPWWTPGTASGYHSFTNGFLIGQVIRKVTGKTLKDFIAEDMAGLLGADFLARG